MVSNYLIKSLSLIIKTWLFVIDDDEEEEEEEDADELGNWFSIWQRLKRIRFTLMGILDQDWHLEEQSICRCGQI